MACQPSITSTDDPQPFMRYTSTRLPPDHSGWVVKEGKRLRQPYPRYMTLRGFHLSNHRHDYNAPGLASAPSDAPLPACPTAPAHATAAATATAAAVPMVPRAMSSSSTTTTTTTAATTAMSSSDATWVLDLRGADITPGSRRHEIVISVKHPGGPGSRARSLRRRHQSLPLQPQQSQQPQQQQQQQQQQQRMLRHHHFHYHHHRLSIFVASRREFRAWMHALRRASACGRPPGGPLSASSSLDIETFYQLGAAIGDGVNGDVYCGRDRATGERVAVKTLPLVGSQRTVTEEEISIASGLSHKHLVRTYDVFRDEANGVAHLVMELVPGGELRARVDNLDVSQCITQDETRCIARHVLSAIVYLHERGIVHRDIKLENVLCVTPPPNTGNGGGSGGGDGVATASPIRVKLADFGSSTIITHTKKALHSAVGTGYYIAPEMIRDEPYGTPVDLWACGVLLYIMLSRQLPFIGLEVEEYFDSVLAAPVEFPDEDWTGIDAQAIDLISKLMERDPAKRLTAKQALKHPWLDSIDDDDESSDDDAHVINKTDNSNRAGDCNDDDDDDDDDDFDDDDEDIENNEFFCVHDLADGNHNRFGQDAAANDDAESDAHIKKRSLGRLARNGTGGSAGGGGGLMGAGRSLFNLKRRSPGDILAQRRAKDGDQWDRTSAGGGRRTRNMSRS